MSKIKWARPEKRLLWLSAFLCGAPLVSSAIYEWNNRVPEVNLLPRVVPNPNAEAWFRCASAAYVPPRRNTKIAGGSIAGGGVDLPLEEMPARIVPVPYTAQYNHIYPLARKKAFLQANAAALVNLRRGLQIPYAYSLSGCAESDTYWSHFHSLRRLLLVEAHARAQQNDWDAAANSLLDAYHFSCVLPQEAPLMALSRGYQIRTAVRRDFWVLTPHLSAQKLRDAARKIETYRSKVPSLAQSLNWAKRCRQEMLLQLIDQNDLRLIATGYPYACADLKNAACNASKANIERNKKALPSLLQVQLAWMSKSQMMQEMTRHIDWQIAQVKNSYPQRSKKWPEPKVNDALDDFIHPNYWRASLIYARGEAQDALLSTSLAIRAFRLEKGRNPHILSQLVPRYLARVPLDPFSNKQALRYQNQAKRFVVSEMYEPIYASAPSELNSPLPPALSGFSAYRTVQRFEIVPFTLYSIGHNARNDGGTPYEIKIERERLRRYAVDYLQSDSISADIVAGINN